MIAFNMKTTYFPTNLLQVSIHLNPL